MLMVFKTTKRFTVFIFVHAIYPIIFVDKQHKFKVPQIEIELPFVWYKSSNVRWCWDRPFVDQI